MPGESQAPVYVPLPDVGQLLDGKYRIERMIGRGGMGAVYQARHEVLGQPVAIKFLLPEVSASPQAVARFLNEARAAAQIHNDHVARVLDVVQLQGGGAYMVLEYLEGMDLATLVANQGPLPVAEAVSYLLQSLEAIAQAHALGIVHRDFKPANLFLSHRPDGTTSVKVLDFGISKSGPGTSLTATNAMLGSPSFMSPEQVRSPKSVDARSDLWSAGVCLYHLLTKDLPYKGDTAGEVFAAILEQIPLPPRYLVPSLPPELEGVVMKCLQHHPEERFADVCALAAALAPFADEKDRGAVERIRHTMSGSIRVPLPLVPAPGGEGVTSNPVRLTGSPPPALPVYRRISKPEVLKQEPYQAEKTSYPAPDPPAPAPAAVAAPAEAPAPFAPPPAAPPSPAVDPAALVPEKMPEPPKGLEGLELVLPSKPAQAAAKAEEPSASALEFPTPAAASPAPERLDDEAPTSRSQVRKRAEPVRAAAPAPDAVPAPVFAPAPVAAAPAQPPPPAAASLSHPRKSGTFSRTPAPSPAPLPLSAVATPASAPAAALPELTPELAGAATEPAMPAFKRPQPIDLSKEETEDEEKEADTEQMDSPFAPKAFAPANPAEAVAPAPRKRASLADSDEDTELSSADEVDGGPTERLESESLGLSDDETAVKPSSAPTEKSPALGHPRRAEKAMTVVGILLLLAALGLGGYLVYTRVIAPRATSASEQPVPPPSP